MVCFLILETKSKSRKKCSVSLTVTGTASIRNQQNPTFPSYWKLYAYSWSKPTCHVAHLFRSVRSQTSVTNKNEYDSEKILVYWVQKAYIICTAIKPKRQDTTVQEFH